MDGERERGGARRAGPAHRLLRVRAQDGQGVLEYVGVLVLVTAIIAAVASLNVPVSLANAVSCEVKQITQSGCAQGAAAVSAGSALGTANPISPTGRAPTEAQMEKILGSNRLIDACAGNGQSEIGADNAPDSPACKAQLAQLSPRARSVLELMAALFQSEHDWRPGEGQTRAQYFQTLLASYLQNPGDAVIALSRTAQALQSGPILANQKLESTPGDLWDGFLGSLCGGYGVCLGGTTLSQAYQQAYHASADIAKVTSTVLLATGVAGALKDVFGAGVKAVLARFGTTESQELEQTVEELQSEAENGGNEEPPSSGGGGKPPPGGGPGGWQPVNESMSDRARAYQEQITGHSSSEAYVVGGVKFDGYRDGVLIDAKGPGYDWAVKDGEFIPNYRGAQAMVDQATRQVAAANGTPIEWDVAEPQAKEAIQTLLEDNGITGITVRYVPPRP